MRPHPWRQRSRQLLLAAPRDRRCPAFRTTSPRRCLDGSTTSVPPHSNDASGRAVRRSNARDPPARGDRHDRQTLRRLQERRSRGGPPFRHPLQSTLRRAHDGDLALETFREVEDDVDAATPVDAQNAPTGVWKSRTECEIPTAPTSILFSDEEEERRTKPLRSSVHRIGSDHPQLP